MKILLVISFIVVILFPYSLIVKNRVATHAELIADGQPYCILVPGGRYGYKPAEGFIDTMGLLMRGSKAQNHAVLVVGSKENPETYHWSYFNFGFEEGALITGGGFDCTK